MDDAPRTELEAAAFRRLLHHLMDKRPDVQNIDMMNLAGFCRNCLSRWYQEEAERARHHHDKDEARSTIYGMPYDDWRALHQTVPRQGFTRRLQECSAIALDRGVLRWIVSTWAAIQPIS
jgi:uncharacterized protein